MYGAASGQRVGISISRLKRALGTHWPVWCTADRIGAAMLALALALVLVLGHSATHSADTDTETPLPCENEGCENGTP